MHFIFDKAVKRWKFNATLKKSIVDGKTVEEGMKIYSKPIDLFGTGGGFRTATAMNIPFLGQIPVDDRMVKCADVGISYIEKYQDSEVTQVFNPIVVKNLDRG